MSKVLENCTLCGACYEVCPTQSIFKGKKKAVIDVDTCTECAVCVAVCPENAIEQGKREIE